jgi:hypothetical protein
MHIGIDPGISAGAIAITLGKEIIFHKMPDNFRDIKEILKRYAMPNLDDKASCYIEKLNQRPLQNPFTNARMKPMYDNVRDLQNALMDCNIKYKEVYPREWQKHHNLIIPSNIGEKGVDYERMGKLKNEQKKIERHLKIDSDLERRMQNDDYVFFTKKELRKALKEIEKEMSAIKTKESYIRKKRYKEYAESLYKGKLTMWQADAYLILKYQKDNEK